MAIIIDSITADPPRVRPGGTSTVTVKAHDTSAREIVLSGYGEDTATGEAVFMTTKVTLGRPVRFTSRSPLRGTLRPVQRHPGVFIYTADSAPHPH